MSNVRIGIVGVGNMGGTHARLIAGGKIAGLELAALCDANAKSLRAFPDVRGFASLDALLAARAVDAVLIATPHFDHVSAGIAALKAGLHVLVEKPIAVHKADAQRLARVAHSRRRLVFAAMFNQRTDRFYQKIRSMVQSGELGEIVRVNWIVTDWFRPAAYYASGSWRATWAGEGGGVLLNQCPHNLDLFQWIFGLPRRVRAFCGFGRHHDIEVEDDVTAYMEYANGATAVFITSTGEAPGTNRLEVAGDRGRLVYENDSLVFHRNLVPAREFGRTTTQPFSRPPIEEIRLPVDGHGGQHAEILQNFSDAIRHPDKSGLIAPGAEGVRSVELANAMLLSAWTGETVPLPMDAAEYSRQLALRVLQSKKRRPGTARARVATTPP